MNTDLCPEPEILNRLLLGQLPDPDFAKLEEHLSACQDCADAIQKAGADDELVSAIRQSQPHRRTADEETLVSELIDRLKPLRGNTESSRNDGTLQRAHANIADREELGDRETVAEAIGLEFLSPAQGPGEIGRLGDYRIMSVVGSGGMGVVFRAEDTKLGRVVALKAMLPSGAASRRAKQRFLREARAIASIEHDNIVTVYHVGEDQGVPYLVMPLLKGESLRDRLNRRQTLDSCEVVRMGREIAAGLAAAHARGLLHRDIKPDNIWLEEGTGRVKIVDFGLARAAEGDEEITRIGNIVGTPRYMAPEQAKGQQVDQRSDLFSLGTVLYCACTGEAPFSGSNVTATLIAVATEPAKPIKALNPHLDERLAAIIMRLLEKDPQDRFATAMEVFDSLGQIDTVASEASDEAGALPSRINDTSSGTAETIAYRAVSIDTAPSKSDVSPTPSTTRSRSRSTASQHNADRFRRSRNIAIATGGLLLLVLGGIVLLLPDKNGTIRVEINDPDIEVVVGENGYKIKGASEEEIKLEPGEHLLKIKRGGFSFETDKFVLRKGEQVVLKVEFIQDEIKVTRGETVIARKTIKPTRPVDLEEVESDGTPATNSAAENAKLDRDAAELVLKKHSFPIIVVGGARKTIRSRSELPESKPFEFRGFVGPGGRWSGIHPDGLTDEDCRQLAKCTRIDQIGLGGSRVTPAGLAHFKACKNVQWLNLTERFSKEGIAVAVGFRRLKYLGVPHVQADEWAQAFAGNESLVTLNFYRTEFSDAGTAKLVGMPNLTALDLVNTRVSDAGLKEIAQIQSLEYLALSGESITDEGIEVLADLKNLRTLVVLTKKQFAAIEKLKTAFPNCNFEQGDRNGLWNPLKGRALDFEDP